MAKPDMKRREMVTEQHPTEKMRSKLKIDRDDLETDLGEQPDLFWHVASAAAEATAVRDGLKLDIDNMEAELDSTIRAAALDREEKITEASVKQQIAQDAKLQGLKAKLIDANKDCNLWNAMKESFHQRSYMMRELVALALRSYSDQNAVNASDNARRTFNDASASVAKSRIDEKRREVKGGRARY